MTRSCNTLGPILGFHGCDRRLAEGVLSGRVALQASQNDYDWLGPGVYFWVDSPTRGLDWACQQTIRKQDQGFAVEPYVIGAFIHPGLCLNLTDYAVGVELRNAYLSMVQVFGRSNAPLPKNTVLADGVYLKRALDCAVINTVHQSRRESGLPPYQTVYGIFEEGQPMYPNGGFKNKTHVQIAVRDPDCILGYFRVRELPLAA